MRSCPSPGSLCTYSAPPPRPGDQHRPSITSPGSQPSDTKQPWLRALLFPSRGWRGACFPLLPFRTQTGMYLGQPGRGWTCQGPAWGKGVAMTASFRFLASPGCVSSSFSPCSRWVRADVLARSGPRGGRNGGGEAHFSYPDAP